MTYDEIIQYGLSLGIEELELSVQKVNSTTIDVFKGNLDNFNTKDLFSLQIRGIYKGKMGNVSLETLEEEPVKNALNELILNARIVTDAAVEVLYDGSGVYEKVDNPKSDYELHSTQEKITLLKKLENDIHKTNPLITELNGSHYSESHVDSVLVNSKGVNLHNEYSYIVVYAPAIARDKDDTSVSYAIDCENAFGKIEWNRLVEESTSTALSLLNAGFVQTGNYPVVLDKEVASEIIQAFSSMFSGESAIKKMTLLSGKENTKVFGDNITIIDNPICHEALVKTSFDAEGVPTRKNVIVEKGVFKYFLQNLKTAKHFNTNSTGNGVRQGGSIGVAPLFLYVQPGTKTKEEIISTVEDGIYVKEVSGLHAGINPISGDFNVQSKGYLIKNGKIDKPVTLFIISGNFFEMMNNVEEIGKDFDLTKSMDGYACSCLKVKNLKVSGK